MDPVTPRVVPWLMFWAGFAALDYWADTRGHSLSHATRRLCHTHHPAGRATVTLGLTIGAHVLARHLNKPT